MNNGIEKEVSDIEKIIYSYLPEGRTEQKVIFDAMDYTMKAGGKRVRPMLMLETYKLFGGTENVINPFLAAIEMIHTYSLIHDDLPALDNDDYRRGRKTAHIVFGEDMAILAGDALLNYAFEVATTAFELENANYIQVGKALRTLARKPGIYGMIGGQVVDVKLTDKQITKEQLDFIFRLKTGALIEASMVIGAQLAGAPDENVNIVEQIAKNIGMAFQIQDDILDVTSTIQILGKPIHSDEKNDKTTYITLYGIEKAREDVEYYSSKAIELIDSLEYTNDFLRELIISLISREK